MTESTDWNARRHEATAHLETLRRERGDALLDGKTFNNKTVADAEAALDAINAAEAGEEARARSSWAALEAGRKKRLREQLEAVMLERTNAMNAAEDACAALAMALQSLLDGSANAVAIFQALGLRQPLHLNAESVKLRAGLRMASILRPVTTRRFGQIQFPEARGPVLPDGTRVSDSWSEADAIKIADDLRAALNHEETP
jgi:hypothetical protein